MATKIGLNIQNALQDGNGNPRPYSADEKRKRDAIIDRLQSAGNLFMDDIDGARDCKRRYPNMIVVHRSWRNDDGYLYENLNATQFYDQYAKFGEQGIVVQAMNEPTGYGAQNSPQDLEKVAGWSAQVMDLFGTAGHALALPNFGEGHPHEVRLAELKALFEGLKKWKDLHYYASHEYGTWQGMTYDDPADKADVYPWRVGRFKFIAEHCQKAHGFIPNMLITEWGIDSAHDGKPFRGWRTTTRTARQYARELIQCVKDVYSPDFIKALFIYVVGNTGKRNTEHDWWSFDVWGADEFFDELEADSRANQPTPEVKPMPLGKPTNAGDKQKVRLIKAAEGFVNLRAGPGEFFEDVGDVLLSDRFYVYFTPRTAGRPYDWYWVEGTRAGDGWMALTSPDMFEVIADPTPAPIPAPDPELKHLVRELIVSVNRLAAALERTAEIEEKWTPKVLS